MGITLSHGSALDALRFLRREGHNVREMDSTDLGRPTPWRGKRWTAHAFSAEDWPWPKPSPRHTLNVLVPSQTDRIRMRYVDSHACSYALPRKPIVWLDERASMVCPELLFLQMSRVFDLPALVMLGYELCGNFVRDVEHPLSGNATIHVVAATSVDEIRAFLDKMHHVWGVRQANEALRYVADNALSPPEALLGTMYSLPVEEGGYDMGPITLNSRVAVDGNGQSSVKARYPDLMFAFAPLGINYDGEDHLDLDGLIDAAQLPRYADGQYASAHRDAFGALLEKRDAVRKKVVDDNTRNRQLAASGKLVLPATKENLESIEDLDAFTVDLLHAGEHFFGMNIQRFLNSIEDSNNKGSRRDLLYSLLPQYGTARDMSGLF